MKRIYFDHAATTPVSTAVFEAMRPYFDGVFGNADSLHRYGREAAAAVDQARRDIAALLSVSHTSIFFTSGGTEANNWAVHGLTESVLYRGGKVRLIVSAVEHPSVLQAAAAAAARGAEVVRLPVNREGIVEPELLKKALTPDTVLVSVMYINNETGAVQPIGRLAEITHEAGALFHTDAVQAFGSVPVDIGRLGADLVTLSAHKLYGPKGAGLLYVKEGIQLASLITGGHQEQSRRGGTVNVPGVVGMAAALRSAAEGVRSNAAHIALLRDRFIEKLKEEVPFVRINGPASGGHPGIVNIGFELVESKLLIERLDIAGIACSPGSACSSGLPDPSHVLVAMGLTGDDAYGVRFSFGKNNTVEEVDFAVKKISELVFDLREVTDLFARLNDSPPGII